MVNIEKIRAEKPVKELLEFSIINIDKPSGPTSFGVDVIVKKALGINKTSHFGTLDPMVTGVLPVALGRACKLMPYFIGKRKKYIGVMRLHKELDIKELNKEIKNFVGKITQMPPVKSRVKRQFREREIYTFDILEISENKKDVLFETEVEAGTYIRKLIDDLGKNIGGAHMLELRRTQASIFLENDSIDIYKFLEAVEEYKKGDENPLRNILIPGEIISKVLPILEIKKQYIKKLYHGSPLLKEYLKNDKALNKINTDKIIVFCDNLFIGTFKKSEKENNIAIAHPEYVLQPIK
ncbi:MAG: RNA-guided pseudouridylation complex pseudouridine synthase subunit Cbf5 [Nanoarchaeota archaeon]